MYLTLVTDFLNIDGEIQKFNIEFGNRKMFAIVVGQKPGRGHTGT